MDQSRNKRIAKNTFVLYLRMILVTMVSLFTSRVILQVLGVEDYGIFNLAGGLIAFFSIINSSLSSSAQRFLNIELGKGDYIRFIEVKDMSILINAVIAFSIFVLGETIGLYIFTNYLNIPIERQNAALWVYHFSLLSTVVTILRTPYSAIIISKERLTFFAYLAIAEVVLKLLIVYLLYFSSDIDSLILYSILYFCVSFIIFFANLLYVRIKLHMPKFCYGGLKKEQFAPMFKFSVYSFGGDVANVFSMQGINMLMNVYFGVTVNAAMGITSQVTNTISGFMVNYQMAYKPALIQQFVTSSRSDFLYFVYRTSKFSYLLMLFFAVPVICFAKPILELWLEIVPEYTAGFISLLMISLLLNAANLPFYNALEANGKIVTYQTGFILIKFSILIIAFTLLRLEYTPFIIVGLTALTDLLFLFMRIYYVWRYLGADLMDMWKILFRSILLTTILAFVLSAILKEYASENISALLLIPISVLLTLFVIITLGLNKNEKLLLKKLINKVR